MIRWMQWLAVITIAVVIHASTGWALVQVDINRGMVEPLPLAFPKMTTHTDEEKKMSEDVARVIKQDLVNSGLFRFINEDAFLTKSLDVQTLPEFSNWRPIGASALLVSNLYKRKIDEFSTEFRLWDILAQQPLAESRYTTNRKNWRRLAHMMSDKVYQRLTGESGYFDTRIVYVAESGPATRRVKRLAIVDQDGANHRFLTDGKYLVLTPRFSPTAQEVIYLSYQGKIPKVYIRHVDTGKEKLVGQFEGMSFAPRFAPDGKMAIMSVTNNGNSDIYALDLKNGKQERLTHDRSINTSPSYSPDGKFIVFNSDRAGSQQLYVMDRHGKGVKRISFGQGRYGTPVWSPRGDYIAFTKIYNGRFYIGVMREDGTGERLLTESFLDEGPTWAPNGRIILFARQTKLSGKAHSKWGIYTVDLTGHNEQQMPTPLDASDPAWSPLL